MPSRGIHPAFMVLYLPRNVQCSLTPSIYYGSAAVTMDPLGQATKMVAHI